MTDPATIADRIADGGPVITERGGGFMVRCPAHLDGRPSLHISPGHDQPVILKCFAGCHRDDILFAAGLSMDDIAKPLERGSEVWTPRGVAVAVYTYANEVGQVLFEVCRTADKQFPCRVPDPSAKSGYTWRMGEARRVLYRLPEVIAAIAAGQEIWVCEGEKDALRVSSAGVCATTAPGGSGPSVWRPEYTATLAGATVTIVADKDTPGQTFARQVRDLLVAAECRVRIVEAAPDAEKDASDHFDKKHTLAEFVLTVPYERISRRKTYQIQDYISRNLPPRQFVIAGTLARGEVMGVTGFEGHGKSTLLKQIAITTALGTHFLSGVDMPVRRVLQIDCENDEENNLEDLAKLAKIAAHHRNKVTADTPLFQIDCGAIDLATETDLAWLVERVTAYQPDLLVIGPLYNMIGRELRGEDDARIIKNAIDAAQAVNGCAVIWEHHVPHEQGGNKRDTRPIGSSLLLRWPSFGFGLMPVTDSNGVETGVYEWKSWRGARRINRLWPERLTYGRGAGVWPWVEDRPAT